MDVNEKALLDDVGYIKTGKLASIVHMSIVFVLISRKIIYLCSDFVYV